MGPPRLANGDSQVASDRKSVMPSPRATKIAGGAAGISFTIFMAVALIHFAGWTQSHSTVVADIMYASLFLSVSCFLLWFFAQAQGEALSDPDPVRSQPVPAGSASASSGNIHFAPVIQVGNVGAPAVSPISQPVVALPPSVAPPPTVALDSADDLKQELPDLDLSFAQGKAVIKDSMLRYSDAGEYCIAVRVFNRPATTKCGALVARKIVASVRLNSGSKAASVESSCWIDRDPNQIDLGPGAYADALLVLGAREALTMCDNRNPFPREDLAWNAPFSEPERVPFPLRVPAVVTGEVYIISRANHLRHTTLAHRKFLIRLDDKGSSLSAINIGWADSPAPDEGAVSFLREPLSESNGAQIELLDVETRPVYMDDEGEVWRIGPMPGWRARALLLPFYLDPKRSAPGTRVEHAMAHLVFIGDSSAKVRIAHGCWINASLDTAEIRLGETKHLILAIESDDPSLPFIALSTNRTCVGWQNESGEKPFEESELPRGRYRVEVTLIWGGNSEFRKTFEVALVLS